MSLPIHHLPSRSTLLWIKYGLVAVEGAIVWHLAAKLSLLDICLLVLLVNLESLSTAADKDIDRIDDAAKRCGVEYDFTSEGR